MVIAAIFAATDLSPHENFDVFMVAVVSATIALVGVGALGTWVEAF